MNPATAEHAVEVLNRIHAADPSVLPTLIAHRVPCNDAVADDPTVQVLGLPDGSVVGVGLLGVINGIFGVQDGTSKAFIGYRKGARDNIEEFILVDA